MVHISCWKITSTREINSLKGDSSIFSGFVPLNCIILHIVQFARFLPVDYLTIKFGEYYHKRNCGGVTNLL